MKNKTITILLIVLISLFSISYADECEGFSNDDECFNNYEDYFDTDPVTAAQTYPDEYMKLIEEDDWVVSHHPDAYEVVIEQNIDYLNQNKNAFQKYTAYYNNERGGLILIQEINCDFDSYDSVDGTITTKGNNGEAGTTFTLEAVELLREKINTNRIILDENGRLTYESYDLPEGTMVYIQGEMRNIAEYIYIKEGSFSTSDGQIISVSGKSSLEIPHRSCSDSDCGLVIVHVEDSPVALPNGGTLTKGSAVIKDFQTIELKHYSRYITSRATFEVSQPTRISSQDIQECTSSCFIDGISYIFEDSESNNLIVKAIDGNNIQIETEDGNYKDIIIKQMTDENKYDEVGKFNNYFIYVDQSGNLHYKTDRVYVAKPIEELNNWKLLRKKVMESEDFAQDYEFAKSQTSRVELTVTKDDDSQVFIEFTRDEPISQGVLDGLQSNIATVYSIGQEDTEKFPWILYNGEKDADPEGSLYSGYVNKVINLVSRGEADKVELLLQAGDLSLDEARTTIENIESLEDKEYIADKYVEIRSNLRNYDENQKIILKLEVTTSSTELQNKIIDNFEEIEPDSVRQFLRVVEDVDVEKKILEKSTTISYPGRALEYTESDEIKRMIIERTRTNLFYDESCRRPIGNICFEELEEYVSSLESLSPELRELAIDNFDFELEGSLFTHEHYKGRALRTVINLYKEDHQLLANVLDTIPADKDLDFNPELFSEIYFHEGFQVQTSELDFANKFSVALTAQRYLERSGKEATIENMQEVTELILTQRTTFANHIILDENTHFIPLTHEDDFNFHNDKMVTLARDAGVTNIANEELRGKENKDQFREIVRDSGKQEKTTIYFNGHGGPKHMWLSDGEAGNEDSEDMETPRAISYIEFGNDLASRGNLGEVTIMIDACYSSDFKNNLLAYLDEQGIREMPVIITETNRGQVGWTNTFFPALEEAHEPGTPVTGADMYEVESITFVQQDLSITIPIEDEALQQYSDPKTPGVIDIGSLYDEGEAEPPSRMTGEPEDELDTAPMPPTVIEISDNIQELEERFGISLTDETSITT
jgi:hypothetical protein